MQNLELAGSSYYGHVHAGRCASRPSAHTNFRYGRHPTLLGSVRCLARSLHLLVFAAGLEAAEGPLGGDLGGAEALGGAFKGDAASFLSRSGSCKAVSSC
jgi:hypothetical protein